MLRILFDATPYVPDRLTGAGRLVQQSVRHFIDLDHTNRYHLFGFAPEIWPPTSLPPNFSYTQIHPWRLLGPLAQEAARRNFIGTQLTKLPLDVVHCTLEMTPIYDERTRLLFSLYDLARRSPHFLSSTPRTSRSRARTWLRYRLARKADLIHTISDYSAEQISHTLGIARRRIRVVYPGVDPVFVSGEPDPAVLREFGLDAGQYFLFVGQFGRQKNEDGLLEAFSAAVAQNAVGEARLALVGDTTFMAASTRALLQSGGERIALLGNVPDDKLVHLYRGALALVLPSFHEGFGLPVAEAMACGSTAIVSNATSLPEVVSDGGLVVTVGRKDELAAALARLVRDPELRTALRRRAAVRATRFTFTAYARGLLAIYREMADG